MSELLREIEEDIRAERLSRLWDKFGKSMVRISIAIVIGTSGGVAWKHYQKSEAMDATAQLLAGMEKLGAGDNKAAITLLDDAIDSGSVYADIALLQKGQAQKALGDREGADKTYQQLADRNSKTVFATLGKLLAAKETDAPVTVDEKGAFASLQREMRGWQLLKAGKKEEAVKLFVALRNDASAPQAQRARMAAVLSTVAPEHMLMSDIPADDTRE